MGAANREANIVAEARITCCPFCSTSFRVSDQQLTVANGSVRCGSCLRVFMAELYFMDTFMDTNGVDSGGTGSDDKVNNKAKIVQLSEHQEKTDSREQGHRRRALQKVQEQLNEKQKEKFRPLRGKKEKATALIEEQDKPEEKSESEKILQGVISDDEDKWDESIPSLSVEAAVKGLQGGLNWDESQVVLDTKEKNYIQRVVDVDRYERFRQEITQRFRGYEANWRWFFLSLLLLLTLFLQYAWYNKDHFSMNPDYRVWYEKACNYFNCSLPDYLNYAEMHATDLVIRPHTQKQSALMVDALLRNDSVFRQPFPDLILQFRTIKDEVIAHRQFSASEYLKGELTGLKYIPPRTEVRLALEIVDPGDAAVNYSLQIVDH